jgi:hypothetical protein
MRAGDAAFRVRLELQRDRAALTVRDGDRDFDIARVEELNLQGDRPVPVLITLEGRRLRFAVDGEAVLAADLPQDVPGGFVGLASGPGAADSRVRDFEVHAARLAMPPELVAPPILPFRGVHIAAQERFEGPSRPLEGKTTTCGTAAWQRQIGRGRIETTGDGRGRVVATVRDPNPGRTAFSLPWAQPAGADLEVTMTVPGTGPGEWHKPRGGLLFWQDPDNHVIVSVWRGDEYPGASVSSFFRIDGYEEIYDAVWTNVGRRIWYGDTVTLRAACDGRQYLVHLDGEPVLFRELTDVYPDCPRLRINRVGLVVNWEWGNDTGTVFREFTARSAEPASQNPG